MPEDIPEVSMIQLIQISIPPRSISIYLQVNRKHPLHGKIQRQTQFEIQYSINSNHQRRQRCIDIVVELQNINFRGSHLFIID